MASASFLVTVGLISLATSAVCATLVSLFLFRRLKRHASLRSLRQLEQEVTELTSLYASLLDAHKRLSGRLAKTAQRTQEKAQETSESPRDWKSRMRRQMAANQLSGRHPAAGLTSEDNS